MTNIKTLLNFDQIIKIISKKKLSLKKIQIRIKSTGGRLHGKIISPRRGDFIKRLYRFIDFRRVILPQAKAVYLRTIYDPNRTSAIGLLCYPIGLMNYILKPSKIDIGDLICNIENIENSIFYGDASKLSNFSSGVLLYNINGKFIRSAGASSILVRKDSQQALLKMKSGELRHFNQDLIASSGSVSNDNHFLRQYNKAGVIRYLGRRPRTRPAAMNPVDHPMGGRTRGGSFPKNKKGIITLNRPTVKKHNFKIVYTKRQLKLLNN